MKALRARATALTLLAVVATVGVAACGSSSTSSSSSSAAASAGAAPTSAARTKLAACLKQHGVTLPARPAGARTRPPGQGGYGTPPGGGSGFFGGGGGGPGGAGARGRFSNPKTRAALQACAKAAGLNFRGPRNGRSFRPTQAAITKFASCVKQHGYTLPKANLSGKGPVYPAKIETNKAFQTAARACQSVLRPAGGGAGAGAAPPGA